MTIRSDAAGAGGVMPPAMASAGHRDAVPAATVQVWDPFVRVFHWSLIGLFALAFATGDEIEWLHLAAGPRRATSDTTPPGARWSSPCSRCSPASPRPAS